MIIIIETYFVYNFITINVNIEYKCSVDNDMTSEYKRFYLYFLLFVTTIKL